MLTPNLQAYPACSHCLDMLWFQPEWVAYQPEPCLQLFNYIKTVILLLCDVCFYRSLWLCCSECNCVFEELLIMLFSAISFTDKLTIESKYRLMSLMPNLKSKVKKFTQCLKQQNYILFKWLCRCKKLTKLYCFLFLLLLTGRSIIWTQTGFNNNLYNVRKKA